MDPVMDKDIEEFGTIFKLEDNIKMFTVSKDHDETITQID